MVASCYRSNVDHVAAITAAHTLFSIAITATVILTTMLLLLQQLVGILHSCCRSNHMSFFYTAITALAIWYDVALAATLLFLAVAIAATSCTVAVAATDVN